MTTNTPTPFDIIEWYAAQHNGNPPRGTKHIRELPDGYGAFIKENFEVMQVCLTTGRVLYDAWVDEATGEMVPYMELMARERYYNGGTPDEFDHADAVLSADIPTLSDYTLFLEIDPELRDAGTMTAEEMLAGDNFFNVPEAYDAYEAVPVRWSRTSPGHPAYGSPVFNPHTEN